MAQKGMTELDSRAWRAFHKIGQQLLPHLGRQITAHSGLTAAEYSVLLAISEFDEPTMTLNNLASELGWEISRMSHQVTRMHEGGLLNKVRSSTDSRCYNVSLSTEGKNRITNAVPLQSAEINHCFSQILTKSQLESLIEISKVISDHLEQQHPTNQSNSIQKAS